MSAVTVIYFCRAHMGGLLGGAFAAYLLGPRLVQIALEDQLEGRKRMMTVDRPPLGVFAIKSKPALPA